MTAPDSIPADDGGPSPLLLTVFAVATGVLVANLYYAQPLVAQIAPEIGVDVKVAGAIASVTQLGYGAGLFLLVSLADKVENKRLVLFNIAVVVASLVGIALAKSAAPFLIAALLIGLCSTGAQVLLPFAAHLAPPDRRGRVVGNVMGGLLTGIMLARPLSLFLSASFGWRAVFWTSAVLMVAIGLLLARLMPRHKPANTVTYGQILGSMGRLLRDTPALRWRATYQALMFAGFNLFWTAAPLMLAERFHLDQRGVGLFALAGAGGALAAPVVGRLVDRGLSAWLTGGGMAVLALSFLGADWAAAVLALPVLVVMAVTLDAAIQGTQISSQRVIFSAPLEVRGRMNALYMTITFMGGAAGSTLATVTYAAGGWTTTALTGAAIGGLALVLFAAERALGRRAD